MRRFVNFWRPAHHAKTTNRICLLRRKAEDLDGPAYVQGRTGPETRNIRRQVGNKTEGNNLLKKLLNDIDQHSSTIIDGAKLTFTELATIYRDEKLIEPVYEDGVRVAGLRSYKIERRRLKTLVAHFEKRRVVTITHSDILKFKLKRLKDPNKRDAKQGIDSTLKLASVHRELRLMRAVLNLAKRKGWITRNPFELKP